MKQLLFLLLFPCLALAQYTGNAGQKITLGEQTSADGLVYRGLAADTTRKPSVDTMAYILLDTNTNIIWQYKKAVNNAWTRVGGSISSGVTGVLPVANGGTNTSTAFTTGSVVFAGASGTYTQDNSGLFYDNTNDRLGILTASPSYKLHIKPSNSGRTSHDQRMVMTIESSLEAYYNVNIPSNGYGGFRIHTTPTLDQDAAFEYWAEDKEFHFNSSGYFAFRAKDNVERFRIDSTGNIGIGVTGPTARLHVKGVDVNANNFALKVDDSNNLNLLSVKNNGNVGIGTTSPIAILDVVGANTTDKLTLSTYTTGPTGSNIRLKHARGTVASPSAVVNADDLGQFIFQGYDGTSFLNGAQIKSGVDAAVSTGEMPGFLSFLTNQGAERMRITSNGNVGIGADGSAGYKLDVNGTGRFSGGGLNDPTLKIQAPIYPFIDLIIDNANTNARNWRLAGVYSAYGTFEILSSTTQGDVPTTSRFSINGVTGAVTINNLGTGTVYSNSGVLSNTPPSDERLKNNITNISWGLNDILKLRPVSFNWKDDRANQGKQFGFIAQEVHSIMPEAIKIFGEDFKYLGLEKDAIYATLVKAVQELSAEIDILKQEIINLKNK
jgi:hypothetical protein